MLAAPGVKVQHCGDHGGAQWGCGAYRADGTLYRTGVTSDVSSSELGLPDAKHPITMLADRVLIQLPGAEGERRSRSGIVIPATAQVAKRLSWADVAAVGPHVRTVKAGDKVLFNPEETFEVEVQGDEYLILRERDIHAVAAERLGGSTGLYL